MFTMLTLTLISHEPQTIQQHKFIYTIRSGVDSAQSILSPDVQLNIPHNSANLSHP